MYNGFLMGVTFNCHFDFLGFHRLFFDFTDFVSITLKKFN